MTDSRRAAASIPATEGIAAPTSGLGVQSWSRPTGLPERASEPPHSGLDNLWRHQTADLTTMSRGAGASQVIELSTCQVDANGVPAEWVEVRVATPGQGTLVVFSADTSVGGGRPSGSVLAGQLAVATGARVLEVKTTVVDEAVAAFAWLLEEGVDLATTAFIGESSGGGLTIAALTVGRDQDLPLPAAGVCLSPLLYPWPETSRSCWHTVITTGRRAPAHFRPRKGQSVVSDLSGLPALLILADSSDSCVTDATMLVNAARRAGVPITLQRDNDLIMASDQLAPVLRQVVTIDRIAAWLAEQWI